MSRCFPYLGVITYLCLLVYMWESITFLFIYICIFSCLFCFYLTVHSKNTDRNKGRGTERGHDIQRRLESTTEVAVMWEVLQPFSNWGATIPCNFKCVNKCMSVCCVKFTLNGR